MPQNIRSKLGPGQKERDYLAARKRVIRESQICSICMEAIDISLKPVCVNVDVSGYTVETAHTIPPKCGDGCRHKRKPNPYSPSADHVIPVDRLPPGSPLLTSVKNLQVVHYVCNQRKGAGNVPVVEKFVSSGDWF